MPERIQRRRTRGWRMPEGAVSIERIKQERERAAREEAADE